MARCSFCRKLIEPGTGIMFVKNDGRIFVFCSGKCEKHLLTLDHKPRTTRWTLEFAREKRQAKAATKDVKVKSRESENSRESRKPAVSDELEDAKHRSSLDNRPKAFSSEEK